MIGSLRTLLNERRTTFGLMWLVATSATFLVWIGVLAAGQPSSAEALIFPTSLNVLPAELAQTAASLWEPESDATAGLALQADSVTVGQVESTSVLRVLATHRDPAVAAREANHVGRYIVDRLNSQNPPIGSFALQLEPTVDRSTAPSFVLPGLVSGLVGGLVVLVMAVAAAALGSRRTPPDSGAGAANGAGRSAVSLDRVQPSLGTTTQRTEIGTGGHPSEVTSLSMGLADAGKPEPPQEPAPSDFISRLRDAARIQRVMEELDLHRSEKTEKPVAGLRSAAEEPEEGGSDHDSKPRNVVLAISGIGPAYGARLAAVGVTTVDQLARCEAIWISSRVGVKREEAKHWIAQAQSAVQERLESPAGRPSGLRVVDEAHG